MQSPGQGNAKINPTRARSEAKRKRNPLRQRLRRNDDRNTHDSMENVGTGKGMDRKHLIVGYKQTNKSQGKRLGHGKVEIQGDRNQ